MLVQLSHLRAPRGLRTSASISPALAPARVAVVAGAVDTRISINVYGISTYTRRTRQRQAVTLAPPLVVTHEAPVELPVWLRADLPHRAARQAPHKRRFLPRTSIPACMRFNKNTSSAHVERNATFINN